MRNTCTIALVCAALAFSAQAAPRVDAATACRTAHAEDTAAQIACLEAALRERDEADVSPTLGDEQVRAARQRTSSEQPERMSVRIVSATYNSRELGVFRMADGQLWRETEKTPRHQRLTQDREYAAHIEKGVLGGYRMYVDGVRRMLKVERIE